MPTATDPLSDVRTIAPGAYNEAFDDSEPRPAWQRLLELIAEQPPAERVRRSERADTILTENGVTYGVAGEDDSRERPWMLDLVPLVWDRETWTRIESGLQQRAALYDLLIRDLYGERKTIADGTLVSEVIYAHPGFLRTAIGLHAPVARPDGEAVTTRATLEDRSLILYAAELARAPSGDVWVMADRSDAPAGAGFALENRSVAKRTAGYTPRQFGARSLSSFFARFELTLRALSPRQTEYPRAVVLTGGADQPNYFEDAYLARHLGLDLVQGSDLAVRDSHVYLKTLAGVLPVDVIIARGPERELDPVAMGGAAPHGVPGLLQAVREKTVAVINKPGAGLIEAPVWMAVLAPLCRSLLGEELLLPSIATWWCRGKKEREFVFDELERLVVKPAFDASGGREIFGSDLSSAERDELRKRIDATPHEFVAQERIVRSCVPTVGGDGALVGSHAAVRAFVTAEGDGYSVMPGGLVRATTSRSPMQLSIAGGELSKDLWVCAPEPDPQPAAVPLSAGRAELKRSSAVFPSRIAYDLFWLGQNLSRSEFLARTLGNLVARTQDESPAAKPIGDALAMLTGSARIDEDSPPTESSPIDATDGLPDHVWQAVRDRTFSGGLAFSVAECGRLAGAIRTRISPETYRQLRSLARGYEKSASAAGEDLDALATCLDDLIVDLAALAGLLGLGMTRGPAWCFLQLGRYIEQARCACRFLKPLVPGVDEGAVDLPAELSLFESSSPLLRSILHAFDCQMTHRVRYFDEVRAATVLDLVVTDDTSPRSVAYQLRHAEEQIGYLPDQRSPLPTEETRCVIAALAALHEITGDDLAAEDHGTLVDSLQAIDAKMTELIKVLERKYLIHSGEPRQVGLEPGAVT